MSTTEQPGATQAAQSTEETKGESTESAEQRVPAVQQMDKNSFIVRDPFEVQRMMDDARLM